MFKTTQVRIAILALMLAVSHIALACHVAAHFSPELEQCELCVSHAQLSTAIPAAEQVVVVDVSFGSSGVVTPESAVPALYAIAHRQRAPPLTSA